MIFYLSNFKNLKIFYIFNIVLIAYALYASEILLYFKFVIFFTSCIYIYFKYKKQAFIKGFYLDIDTKKSYLLSSNMQQINVKFIKVEYCSSWLITLIFANKLRSFRVLVFKNQLSYLDDFKKLIILYHYNILPCIAISPE